MLLICTPYKRWSLLHINLSSQHDSSDFRNYVSNLTLTTVACRRGDGPGHPFQGASNQRVKLKLSYVIFEIIAVDFVVQVALHPNLINVADLYLI